MKNQRPPRTQGGLSFLRGVGVALLLLSVSAAHATDWPGWRGGALEARSASPLGPQEVSEKSAVWKTPLKGVGHSSPIVTGDAIYVTSSGSAEPSPRTLVVFRYLLWLALALVVAPTVRFLLRRSLAEDAGSLRELVGRVGTLVLVLALTGLIFYGEGLLNFNRAVERGWIAGCLCGTLALTLSSLYATSARRSALGGGLALLAFAGVLALTIPDRAHTVAADPKSDVSKLIYAVIALPLVVGVVRLLEGTRARVWGRGGLLLIAVGLAGVLRLAVGESGALHRTISTGNPYVPHLAMWWLLVPLVGFGACLALQQTPWARVGAVVLGALTVVLAGLSGAELLLVRVPYLAYLLGEVSFTPILGARAVALLGIVVLVALGVRRGTTDTLPPLVRIAAPLLVVLYGVYANALPRVPRMECGVICLDRQTGAVRWSCGGVISPNHVKHTDNSEATPTPVTDGERVYAYFGTPGMLCVDRTGNRLWVNRELPFETREGVASSPILCQGKVILLSDSDAGGYLAALDGKTGRILWKTPRPQAHHPYAGTCRTPTVATIAGREVVLVWGYEDVSGYDPATGKELWSHPLKEGGLGDNPVASAITDGAHLFLVLPSRALCLDLARLPGTENSVLWRQDTEEGAQCSTPVVVKGLLFAVSDNGVAYCLDTSTGKELWRKDLEQQHYASVLAIGERIYFFGTQGRTTVVACERTFHLLAQSEIAGQLFATGAPVDGKLYLRTKTALYCLH